MKEKKVLKRNLLMTRSCNLKLVQEKIAAVARNGIFLNSSTLGKFLGGSLFRAMTLPYSQYMGAGYTKRKALKAGDMEGAKMAEMRQKLNLAMYLRMFVGTQNSFRLALSAIKHDEVFGNINISSDLILSFILRLNLISLFKYKNLDRHINNNMIIVF